MTEHDLKIWPRFFEAVVAGEKRHELRRNDRNFRVGDTLRLREFDPQTQTYSGREHSCHVTYMTSAEQPCALSDAGLAPGFCILSIAEARARSASSAETEETGRGR